ncbi:hypothetical protein [Rhizobium sp. P44RR-XXIV]|uniref:hypothetical protein n=1 Tax=Rhizobium sp. P44RR-XXIV TaxID=1921145 RepID=UPI0009871E6F|nr:hypothetical protein [Rhizobium sp. P44RR-XXIV]TIX89187.1 hypothetical protein BSK43_021520 [Rhizobium sp. P44RR-XXIV]
MVKPIFHRIKDNGVILFEDREVEVSYEIIVKGNESAIKADGTISGLNEEDRFDFFQATDDLKLRLKSGYVVEFTMAQVAPHGPIHIAIVSPMPGYE